MGVGSQGIKAKQEFNSTSREKWENRFFIQKTGLIPFKVSLRNFKPLLAKIKAKNPAPQDHWNRLAILHKERVDFKIFPHYGQHFHTQALLFLCLKLLPSPEANSWGLGCCLWKDAHQPGLQGIMKDGHRREKWWHYFRKSIYRCNQNSMVLQLTLK